MMAVNIENTAIVEHVSFGEMQERLAVWAEILVNLGVAGQLGAFISVETGSGPVIRVGRHDGMPMAETRGVSTVMIPRPR